MNLVLGPTRRNRLAASLFIASLFGNMFLVSGTAQADCSSARSSCKSDCSLNPLSGPSMLGGMSGGAVGGMALGSCHSDCDAKYKSCLIYENTPQGRAAAHREEESNKTLMKWRAEEDRKASASLKKVDDHFEAIQRQELRWMLDWYNEYGSSDDNRWPAASNLIVGGDAVVQIEMPLRAHFPMPTTSDRSHILPEQLDPSQMKLNRDYFEVLEFLEPGTIVHIDYFSTFGAVAVSVKGDRNHYGSVIAGALKPL